ncbi:MAG: aromatic ring-hydroxylating dioxygenase subunit alpha [Reinekea sp.]|jgi:glycine betaine catabolism A
MTEQDILNITFSDMNMARKEAAALLESRDPNYSLERPLYNDPFIFNLEIQEIFNKQWLFAGMTSEIPDKGSYFTLEIGQSPVLIVRTADGEVAAYHNTCRHRGSRLCSKKSGKVANIVCPYHQWTYDLKGNLLFAGTDYGDSLDKSLHGLKKVQCVTAGGFIYINLDTDADPADMKPFLDTLEEYMEPYDIENSKVAVESNIVEEANWKLVIENNRECYHCGGNHPELLNTILEWDGMTDPRAPQEFLDYCKAQQDDWSAEGIPFEHREFGLRNRIVRMPLAKGAEVMTLDGTSGCTKLMGRIKNRHLGSMRILHLPNSWNHMQGDHCVVFRVLPISAQRTLVTTKWLVHKDAVEGTDYDPAKLRLVWDATNDQDRILAEESQVGINSMAYQPGPYAPGYEFGVVNFVNWYSETFLAGLKG